MKQEEVVIDIDTETVRDVTQPVAATFREEQSIAEAIEQLRDLVQHHFITYLFVVDDTGKLTGVITMRELLFAAHTVTLGSVMIRQPFALTDTMTILEAMHATATKHYPVYPVCNEHGNLVGEVRGAKLFEAQAFEISAMAGSMVGVEKEECSSTTLGRSFRLRQPWLQINLLTAFLAGAVVSAFQGTIDQLVILASFLPVLAGQSGNTGCQALAVTLRGMTLGSLPKDGSQVLVQKEALLGIANGVCVGVSAAVGMYILAASQGNPQALGLSLVVFLAMIVSCAVSGISGALIPLTLKRFGMDPATASSIFLTTATDVVSMGTLLTLATVFVL